jgi:hypothetical protein
MLAFMVAVVLGIVAFSVVIKDPGSMRLLSIPTISVLGGFAGYLIHSPVILVTDRRVIFANRLCKALLIDLEKLEAMRIKQNPLGRLLGYGALHLLVHPPEDLGEGVSLQFRLEKLPDAASLRSAILAAAGALRNYHGDDSAASCRPVQAPIIYKASSCQRVKVSL